LIRLNDITHSLAVDLAVTKGISVLSLIIDSFLKIKMQKNSKGHWVMSDANDVSAATATRLSGAIMSRYKENQLQSKAQVVT